MWKNAIVLCATFFCASAASLPSEDAYSLSDRIDIAKEKVKRGLEELERTYHVVSSPSFELLEPTQKFITKLQNELEMRLMTPDVVIKDPSISFNGTKCMSYFDDFEKVLSELLKQVVRYLENLVLNSSASVGKAVTIGKQTQEKLEALKHQAEGCDESTCISIENQLKTALSKFESEEGLTVDAEAKMVSGMDVDIFKYDLPLYNDYVEKGKTFFQDIITCVNKAHNH